MLLCPNGIGFMVGFFGCLLAGVIAVPMMLPRRQSARDASAGIIADCTPRLALAPAALIGGERGDLVGRFPPRTLEWLAVDDANRPMPPTCRISAAAGPDDIAFLQYTSGSTSAPKGVMVSHANLLANLAMIERAFGNTPASTYVSWVPLYHDMGLIINALQSLYIGAACVLMAPVAFMQRPLLWLRAISDYRAEVAGGPNFAFDLCVERYRPEQMDGRRPVRLEARFQRRRAGAGRDDPALHRDLRAARLRRRGDVSGLRHGRGDGAGFGRARAAPVRSRGRSAATACASNRRRRAAR